MNKVIAVVEGSTEQSFIRQVLAPWLRGAASGWILWRRVEHPDPKEATVTRGDATVEDQASIG